MDILLTYLPLFAALAGIVIVMLFNNLVTTVSSHNDRGDYWVFVLFSCVIVLLPLILISAWWEAFETSYWQQGWHLFFDLQQVKNFFWVNWKTELDKRYWLALSIPLIFWLLILIIGLFRKPRPSHKYRWLAGSLGGKDHSSGSRHWLMLFAIFPILLMLATFSEMPGGYPAALWSTLLILVLSLLALALSSPPAFSSLSQQIKTSQEASAITLNNWSEQLIRRKLKLEPNIVHWPADTAPREVFGRPAMNLAEHLQIMGARLVAPELTEAFAALLSPSSEKELQRLVFAPDNCGQIELTALTAKILNQRYHAVTLVITVNQAASLSVKLQHWLPQNFKVSTFQRTDNFEKADADAMIWVTDAETLSERLLPMMKNPKIAERIGFVVWWQIANFTGVLAANLWAISRRLQRLIQVQGRHDVLTLVLTRNAPHSNDQISRFLNRLLPYHFSAEVETHVESRFARETWLHELQSHEAFFDLQENSKLQTRYRHLLLVAAKVSVEENWPTYLDIPQDISSSEANYILQQTAGSLPVKDRLCQDESIAGARLLKLSANNILDLAEIICQGGRASEFAHACHVGVMLSDNPYVYYLLTKRLKNSGQQENALLQKNNNKQHKDVSFGLSRRLVGAEAHPEIVRRHLVMALNELPDRQSNLLRNFFWNEEVIHSTLDKLYKDHQLTEKEIRYLNLNGELVIESEYQSRQPPQKRLPLDTVGSHLIDIKDISESSGKEVLMCVDPERLLIHAYPHRVFTMDGRRFKIREWSQMELENLLRKGYLECIPENKYSRTWRTRRIPQVYDLQTPSVSVNISNLGKKPLMRVAISLTYEEMVTGVCEEEWNLTACKWEAANWTHFNDGDIRQEFNTQALVLGFPSDAEIIYDEVALISICQVLRSILPVHLGIEENALEVVPVNDMVNNIEINGVAIVDLYPGGIGLIDALRDETKFILDMLKWGLEWLKDCPCQSDNGCEYCVRTTAAKAAVDNDPTQFPQRTKAIELLKQVVG